MPAKIIDWTDTFIESSENEQDSNIIKALLKRIIDGPKPLEEGREDQSLITASYQVKGSNYQLTQLQVSEFVAVLQELNLSHMLPDESNYAAFYRVLKHMVTSPTAMAYMMLNCLVQSTQPYTLATVINKAFDIDASWPTRLFYLQFIVSSVAWAVFTYRLIALSDIADIMERVEEGNNNRNVVKRKSATSVDIENPSSDAREHKVDSKILEIFEEQLAGVSPLGRVATDAMFVLLSTCVIAGDMASADNMYSGIPFLLKNILGVWTGVNDAFDSVGNQLAIATKNHHAHYAMMPELYHTGYLSSRIIGSDIAKGIFTTGAPIILTLLHAVAGVDWSIVDVHLEKYPGVKEGLSVYVLITMGIYGRMLSTVGVEGLDAFSKGGEAGFLTKAFKLLQLDSVFKAVPIGLLFWFTISIFNVPAQITQIAGISVSAVSALTFSASKFGCFNKAADLLTAVAQMKPAMPFFQLVSRVQIPDKIFGLLLCSAAICFGRAKNIAVLSAIGIVSALLLSTSLVMHGKFKRFIALNYYIAATPGYAAILLNWYLNTLVPFYLSWHNEDAKNRPASVGPSYFNDAKYPMAAFLSFVALFVLIGLYISFGDKTALLDKMKIEEHVPTFDTGLLQLMWQGAQSSGSRACAAAGGVMDGVRHCLWGSSKDEESVVAPEDSSSLNASV